MGFDLHPKRKRLEFGFGASDTQKQQDIYLLGYLHSLGVTVPNFTNSVNASFYLYDADGQLMTFVQNVAKNTQGSVVMNCPVPLDGGKITVKVVLSGAPGSAGVVGCTLYYRGKSELGT